MGLKLQAMPSHFKIIECSALPQEGASPEHSVSVDPRIESGLEWLLKEVQINFSALNKRVIDDGIQVQIQDAKERFEKEKSVLRNKIATAFINEIHPSKLPDLGYSNPEDLFTKEDGLTFLAAEIGADLDDLGKEVAALIGYQRMALQMVGALFAPISKKKVPMSWQDIKSLVVGLRNDLGLKS
jgi:hypothetical protein